MTTKHAAAATTAGCIAVLTLGACSTATSASNTQPATPTLKATTALGAEPKASFDPKKTSLCINENVSAPPIEKILKGLHQTLAPYVKAGLTIRQQNPQGSVSASQALDQQFIAQHCSAILTFGTSQVQLAARLTKTIPVLFSGLNNPKDTGVIKSLKDPGSNVTGVRNATDPALEIAAMKQVMPSMKRVGLIWTNGDPNGDAQTTKAKAYLKGHGMTWIDAPIQSAADVTQAVRSLAGRVDAIELPGDATTLAANSAIVRAANSANLPVFGNNAAASGAVLNLAFNYVSFGSGPTASLVLKILNGANPATTPVLQPPTNKLDVNTAAAKRFGLTIPSSVRSRILHAYS